MHTPSFGFAGICRPQAQRCRCNRQESTLWLAAQTRNCACARTDPKLLLLDEPTAGMNPNETIDLTNFIQRLRKELNLTILLIEHHMRV